MEIRLSPAVEPAAESAKPCTLSPQICLKY
jgi:hypothetical protein